MALLCVFVGFRVHTQTALALQPELPHTAAHGMSKLNILMTPAAVFTKYIFKSGIFLVPQERPVLENSVEKINPQNQKRGRARVCFDARFFPVPSHVTLGFR